MQIENLYVAIGKVIPELYREFSANVHTEATPFGIILKVISEVRRELCNFAKTLQQIVLISASQRSKIIRNFNGDQQPRVAH